MHGGLDIFSILLESGIIVKFVLLTLIVCSILSWAIIFQKMKLLKRIEASNNKFLNYFKASNNLDAIYEEAKTDNDSSLSLMYETGYTELLSIREELKLNDKEDSFKSYFHAHGVSALERSLKLGANVSSDRFDDKLSMLASIGSITPFIGLFGTVWGIIDSFAGLASGGGSIEAVAPGIAEALVATAVGLAAAIPAVWAYNLFNAKIGRFNIEMENFGQEFLNLVERTVLISKE